jgi:hypothetical protein
MGFKLVGKNGCDSEVLLILPHICWRIINCLALNYTIYAVKQNRKIVVLIKKIQLVLLISLALTIIK